MKILQLGKFYPIGGGVEKVMYDLMLGLSSRGVDCDMMCAVRGSESYVKQLNDHAQLIGCASLTQAAATMLSPNMVQALYKARKDYDIIHIHHPYRTS